MNIPTLYLMLGYPGAGKTTTAKIISELTGAVRVTSDEKRLTLFPHPEFTAQEHQELYQKLDDEVEQLLLDSKSVVYDANLNRYQHRLEKYQFAGQHNVRVVLLWIKTPVAVAKTRRLNEAKQQHLVPRNEDPASMFERSVAVFEPPHANEKVIELDGQTITKAGITQLLKELSTDS